MLDQELNPFQKDFVWFLGSDVRLSILRYVWLSKTSLTISHLHKILSSERKKVFNEKDYDYKTIYKQVMQLVDRGYLKLNQQKKKQGKPVIVRIKNKEKTKKVLRKFDELLFS